MDKQDARILVRKINALFRSIDELDGSPAAIERDLMLSYVRQLYDYFLQQPAEGLHRAPEATVVPAVPSPPVPPVVVAPVQEKQPVVMAPEPVVPPAPIPPAPPIPPVSVDTSRVQPSDTATEADSERAHLPQHLDRLFSFKKATELSERLGESPVADLGRAMSINDRLLYMNELFGKDRGALEESLQVLNRFDSFDSARSFLYNLAEQYGWSAENRLEIAHAFIKLVRRRYL
ncbi:MAG: hypothetical protein ACKOAY_08920 [Haliscomenobacter sp.]